MSLPVPPAAVVPAGLLSDRQSNLRGIGLTLLAGVLFSSTNTAAKWVMVDVPTGELLWFRGTIALAVCCLLVRRSEVAAVLHSGQLGLHALRSCFSAIEVGCFYWAIARTPLADITTIYLAAPIYVTAMAALFLREKVGWRRWTAVLIGFVGVLVAVHPAGDSVSTPALVALGGSLLYAVSLVATRRLRAASSTLLVATQMGALMVLSTASAGLGWVMPSGSEFALLVMIGVVSMLAYWCINQGLRLAAASAVAPFNYGSIVWAGLLGFLVFADVPSRATLTGAAIIVGAGLFILLRERAVRR